MFGRKKKKAENRNVNEESVVVVQTASEPIEVREQEDTFVSSSQESSTFPETATSSSTDSHIQPVEPDNIIDIDVMNVKNLQIGYQAETIFMKKSENDQLHIHEYIEYTAYEYLGKVTANRFKTTVRYGRREDVNRQSYVEIYLPDAWKGELTISSQYGHISSDDDWCFERFSAETNEGNITLKTVEAPRIRLASPNGSILVEHTIGFTDLHVMTGAIVANQIDGGAKLETSSGNIQAAFTSVNNLLECNTLGGDIHLVLPQEQGLKVDGISKRGQIETSLKQLTVGQKPGNVQNVSGVIGEKPFYDVRLSTINGNIFIN